MILEGFEHLPDTHVRFDLESYEHLETLDNLATSKS